MYNKSELSKALKQAKAVKSQKKTADIDVDIKDKGYKNPKNSNKPALKLYTDSIYNPTDKDLMLYPDNGMAPVFKPAWDTTTTYFPGANSIVEKQVARDGGRFVDKNDPGNNALELHMFYDKDLYEDGGEYLDLTDAEIEEYRKGGYVVEELPMAQTAGTTETPQVQTPPNPMTYFDAQKPYTYKSGDPLVLNKLKLQEDAVIPYYNERTGEFTTQEGTFKPDQYEKVEVQPGVFVARFKNRDDINIDYSMDPEFNKKYYKHYTKGNQYWPIYSTVPYDPLLQQWRAEDAAETVEQPVVTQRKGGYVNNQITHFQNAGTTGPQAAPMPTGLIPLDAQIKSVSNSPRIEDQRKAEMLRAQKAKEEAEKKKRIEEYKRKEAEKKKQAEAAAKWYDEEKAKRDALGAVMDVAPVQSASSTNVDLEYLVPSVGQWKRQERGLEMLKDQLYEQQETLRRRGFKDAYEYEKSPEGLLRDQALAAEAAWKESGEEAPMVDLGEMAFYDGRAQAANQYIFGPGAKGSYTTDLGTYDSRTGKFTPRPRYYSGSGALQSIDEIWTLPLLATRAPYLAGESLMGLLGTQIPGMSGATLGQAINAGFIGKGLYDLPSTAGSWYDAYQSGTGDYRAPMEKTLWNAADFLGAGEAKEGAKLLAQDVKALKTLPANVLPTYRNIYRVEPTTFTKTSDLSGRWFGPAEEMEFYIRNLKDPNAGTRIIKTRIPTKKWESLSGTNLPERAKQMSIGTGNFKTYMDAANAGEISQGAAKRLSKGVPIESDYYEAISNPRLINLNEGILPESMVDMIRATKSKKIFPKIETVEYPAGDLGREGAFMHYLIESNRVEKPIMGIPRKYFPFKNGGIPKAQMGRTTQIASSPIQLTDELNPFGSLYYDPLDNNKFIANQPYTYAGRPGSYYKMVDGKMHIKNKDTDWKYIEMKDPTGKRLKTLEAGLKSGSTKVFNKPKVTTTINDFYYSKNELQKQQVQNRAEQCWSDANGNCLGSAFRYYDQYVAPKLGLESSWELKESAGLTSGKKGANPNYSVWGESVDSWDLRGAFGDKAKQYYAAPLSNPSELYQKLRGMTEAEKDKYFRDMNLPIGTIITGGMGGFDDGKQMGSSYNEKKGYVASHHSGIVVGYDDYGTPIIYDYGRVRKITDPDNLLMTPNYPINNIFTPQQNVQYTYDYLKKGNKLKQEVTPLSMHIPGIEDISDIDEMGPFLDNLEKNKQKIMDTFNISDSEYNELARISAATALAETKGGKDLGTWRYGVVPAYLTDKLGVGESQGITQINPESVWSQDEKEAWRNPQLVNRLSQLGITRDTYDPWNPYHQAVVTMGLTESNIKAAKANASKNPNVSKDLSDAELAYYQWNIPSALTTTDYEKAARGDNENVKRFMEYYNMMNKQRGGTVEYLTQDEINQLRAGGITVIEE